MCVCIYDHIDLNFTHMCRYTCVLTHLMRAKLRKMVCAHTVVRKLGVRMRDSGYTQHTRDARHKVTLG